MHVEELEVDKNILHLAGVFVMKHNCANVPANNFFPANINVLFILIRPCVALVEKACQEDHTENREQPELSDRVLVVHVRNTVVLPCRVRFLCILTLILYLIFLLLSSFYFCFFFNLRTQFD